MSERYYLDLPHPPEPGESLMLSMEESHHLSRVMRKKQGDTITLFDGRGHEYIALISEIHRDAVELRLMRTLPAEPPPGIVSTFAVALPKGDRQKWLVEKLTELGASRIVPLETEFGVAKGDAAAVSRLRRQAVEAAKQCGRRWLPEITEEMTLESVAKLVPLSETTAAQRLIAHPVAHDAVGQKHLRELTVADEVTIAFGPEGGFSPKELASALETGWVPLGLGSNIMRTETAAIAVAAALLLSR